MAQKIISQGSSYSTKRRIIKQTVEVNMRLMFLSPTADSVRTVSCSSVDYLDTGLLQESLKTDTGSPIELNIRDDSDCKSSAESDNDDSFDNSELDDSSESDVVCEQAETSNAPLSEKLAEFCAVHELSHIVVRDLLTILRPDHPELPTNSRTLLNTPRSYEIKHLSGGGHYYHVGISDGMKALNKCCLVLPNVLKL